MKCNVCKLQNVLKTLNFESFSFWKDFWQSTVFKFRCAGYYKDAAVSPLMFLYFTFSLMKDFSPFVSSSLEVTARTHWPADSHKNELHESLTWICWLSESIWKKKVFGTSLHEGLFDKTWWSCFGCDFQDHQDDFSRRHNLF